MPTTLLVIDDSQLYREALCRLLDDCVPGVHILEAADGRSALDLSQRHSCDLIICDYQLPLMSGSVIIRHLHTRARTLGRPLSPIVLTSSQPDVAVFARSLGVAAFLPKPTQVADIQNIIMPLLPADHGTRISRASRLWRIKLRTA